MLDDSINLPAESEPDRGFEADIGGEGWSGTDIEEAYLKALHAMEDIPWAEGVAAEETFTLPAGTAPAATAPAAEVSAANEGMPVLSPTAAVFTAEAPLAARPTSPEVMASDSLPESMPAPGPRLARGTERPASAAPVEQLSVSPAQVIEAALFVGGGPLTARKICSLLRSSIEADAVERTIDELNDAYIAQARPYEIRLGEGGYRLELRPEYDRLRHRVYGSGPREVRLSQDVLEVLALVAYRQPISQKEIESHGKQNAGNLLRQLLRRDLIAFERGAGGRKDVTFHTTPRFLSVFGLGNLDELPQAEDLVKK